MDNSEDSIVPLIPSAYLTNTLTSKSLKRAQYYCNSFTDFIQMISLHP